MSHFRTASHEYFQSVIGSMKQQGYDLMAWVTMNSARHTFFTKVRFAQESRMFFTVSGKSLIVVLTLRESFGRPLRQTENEVTEWDEKYYSGYWSGFVCYSYDSQKVLRDYLDGREGEVSLSEDGMWDIPVSAYFHGGPLKTHGFSKVDGVIQIDLEPTTPSGSQQDLPTAEVLTHSFGKMLNGTSPFLYRRFRSLQVTDFAPHYTFPNQERDFWEKFPLSRLRQIAPHIWGSDFAFPNPRPRF